MKGNWWVLPLLLAGCIEQGIGVSNRAPEAEITSHRDGDTVREGRSSGFEVGFRMPRLSQPICRSLGM